MPSLRIVNHLTGNHSRACKSLPQCLNSTRFFIATAFLWNLPVAYGLLIQQESTLGVRGCDCQDKQEPKETQSHASTWEEPKKGFSRQLKERL